MPLEAATYIADLQPSNPPGTDLRKQGDDHLRLTKTTLQNTFPNATKPFYFPTFVAKAANYTVLSSEQNKLFGVATAAGVVTLTLPILVAGDAGWSCTIQKTDVSQNALLVAPGATTINGEASLRMSNIYDVVFFVWTGTAWLAFVDKQTIRIRSIVADTVLVEADLDALILCTPAANTTITLPAVANYIGRRLWVTHIPNAAFTTTLDGNAAETVNGVASVTLAIARNTVQLIATTTGWETIGGSSFTVNGLTTEVAPATGDFLAGYDISAAAERKFTIASILALAGAAYPPGHIFGLTMSNDAGDTTNDIAIAAGSCRSDDDTTNITIAATVKRIDAIWAVGTGGGGMNTGAVANNTWYEVMAGVRPDTGVTDVWFTTTANRATPPDVAYTKKRRIGWVRRGVAANLIFTQIDDYFTLTTQVGDVAALAMSATAAAATLTAPPSSIARFRAAMDYGPTSFGSTGIIVFSEIVEGNVTPATSTGIASLSSKGDSDFTDCSVAAHFELRLSSSSTIEWDCTLNSGSGTFSISTFGWVDNRGRLS